MKTHLLLYTFCFLIYSCNSQNMNNNDNNSNMTDNVSGKPEQSKKKYWEELIMTEMRDDKGGLLATIPLPGSWKIHNSKVSITGPDNIRCTDYPLQSFVMNYDPYMQYGSPTPMRAMPDTDQLIREDIIPFAAQEGFRYVQHYELPDLARIDKWYNAQYYSITPVDKHSNVYGIDLKDSKGDPAFMITHIQKNETQDIQMWYYYTSILQSDKNAFDRAKKQLLFSLSNLRYNLEPIMAYNRAEAQRIGQSWAAFNQRLATNQAAFEAQQRTHINTVNGVNNAMMTSWEAKNKAMDNNQTQFIDNIYENRNVINSETGEKYKVADGYNRYWMNSDGQYIATELQNYNPNTDENMNRQKWQELQKIK